MTNFHDLIIHRRSIRRYLPQAIEPEKIKLITNAALMSPSSKRNNGWEFIVVDNKEMLLKMADCRPQGSQLLVNAPLAIVVIGNPSKSDVWYIDCAIASTFIQLQAQDLGLGSCWIQVLDRQKNQTTSAEQDLKQLLLVPDDLRILSIISLGYKNEEKAPFDETKLQHEKIHYNTF
jgi:nitroreductase